MRKKTTWLAVKNMVNAMEIMECIEETRAKGSNKGKHRH